jgi:hypothetical protein
MRKPSSWSFESRLSCDIFVKQTLLVKVLLEILWLVRILCENDNVLRFPGFGIYGAFYFAVNEASKANRG